MPSAHKIHLTINIHCPSESQMPVTFFAICKPLSIEELRLGVSSAEYVNDYQYVDKCIGRHFNPIVTIWIGQQTMKGALSELWALFACQIEVTATKSAASQLTQHALEFHQILKHSVKIMAMRKMNIWLYNSICIIFLCWHRHAIDMADIVHSRRFSTIMTNDGRPNYDIYNWKFKCPQCISEQLYIPS